MHVTPNSIRPILSCAFSDTVHDMSDLHCAVHDCKISETTLQALIDLQVFHAHDLTFHEVYECVIQFPLYGKTRVVNFARGLSAARVALGRSPLTQDELSFQDIVCMYDNVGKALSLLNVKDEHAAEEACIVLSAVIKMCYSHL